jgi:hypothetical protein
VKVPTSDYTPAVASVGAILRTRTKDVNGTAVGSFTATTRPTVDQVAALINTAVGDLATAVGVDIPAATHESARAAATYRAAMLVEISYFPEQVAAGRSPYAQLRELYVDALKDLRTAVEEAGGDVPGDADGDAPAPVYAFPTGVLGLDAALGYPAVASAPPPYSGGLYQ